MVEGAMLQIKAILATILALCPSAPVASPEDQADYEGRATSIAVDIAAVSDTIEDAGALVGVAWHESGFALDVDSGACLERRTRRCDGGLAVSIWQLHDRDPRRFAEFRRDRQAAAREALRRIRGSRQACGAGERAWWLSAYASGSCDRGHEASAGLMRYADRSTARLRLSVSSGLVPSIAPKTP